MTLQARRDFIHINQFDVEDKYIVRDRICPMEIWCELFKGDLNERSKYDVKMVCQMLKEVEGWEQDTKTSRFGKIYGVQRGFKRIKEKSK